MINPPYFLPQHFLYFFPLPQGQGSLGYTFFVPASLLMGTMVGRFPRGRGGSFSLISIGVHPLLIIILV